MDRTYVGFILIFIAAGVVAVTIYLGYTTPGFMAAGAACVVLVYMTLRRTYTTRIEDTILKTGLIQQYLLSNFTIDESALTYLQKLLKEDYNITVNKKQLLPVIENEQTRRELELEKEELHDFKNKYFIGENEPETMEEYIKQFVTVFGRGSPRNVYYLMKVLDGKGIVYSEEKEFTEKIIALKNLIEAEVIKRGGLPKKEEQVTVTVCSRCGNEYPKVLLFCPFCEGEKEGGKEAKAIHVLEPLKVVYCPQCHKPMVRSILKRDNKFAKGFQCRNLKCLYEMTYEESQNT